MKDAIAITHQGPVRSTYIYFNDSQEFKTFLKMLLRFDEQISA